MATIPSHDLLGFMFGTIPGDTSKHKCVFVTKGTLWNYVLGCIIQLLNLNLWEMPELRPGNTGISSCLLQYL